MIEEEKYFLKQEIKRCCFCKKWIEYGNHEKILFKDKYFYLHKFCLERLNDICINKL